MRKRDYSVFNKVELGHYDTNLTTKTKSELTLQHATEIEKAVKEVSGIEKLTPDEKWYDYNQRVLKMQTESAKSLDIKIKALEGKSDITAAEREQLKNYEKLQKENEETLKNTKLGHDSEITKLKAENKIYGSISKVDATLKKDDILKEAIDIVREKTIGDMISSAKFDKDKLVFVGSDGSVLLNKDGTLTTAEQLYSLKMDKYIEKAKTQGGAGGNGNEADSGAVAGIKTQVELNRHLASKGFLSGTPEFTKEFTRLGGEKLPLRF